MKKLLVMLLALVMVFALVACGAKEEAKEPTTEETGMKVAMITDYGDITDQSFNQTTYEACVEFCEANGVEFQYYKPAGDSTAERVAMIDAAIADGYNVIVCPGYAFAGAVGESAPNYPDAKFIVLDVALGDYLGAMVGADYDYNPDNWNLADYTDLSNVYTAIYQEELCGYMAGVAAVKLGYTHIGFFGGMAVPAVMRYGYGFVQGVDAAAVELGIADQVTVEYVYANSFSGSADLTAYMDNWYQNLGVEVVFACGGSIYSSAAEAAAKVEGAKMIGVDTDQSGILNAYADGMTVTSAMKGLAATTKTALKAIMDEEWDSLAGQIATLGLISAEDPSANYVQIPMETTQWADSFTQDDYVAMVAAMFNGELTVSADTTVEPTTTVAVNYYGNVQ